MVRLGGWFSERTTSVRCAWPTRLPASRVEAVMTWVPTVRLLVEKLAPFPIVPSRSDVQRRVAERLPSVASIAEPAKATGG